MSGEGLNMYGVQDDPLWELRVRAHIAFQEHARGRVMPPCSGSSQPDRPYHWTETEVALIRLGTEPR